MTALRFHLLGFDARLPEAETVRNWPAARRLAYLLRDDVRWPLSVDRSVWPSLFRFDLAELDDSGSVIALEPQGFLQSAIDLWDSRAAMEEVLAANASRAGGAIPMAVELWHEMELKADDSWSFIAGSLPADDVPKTWCAVGYDVADRDLVTGLSNCSYNERDRAALRGWAKKINEFGLIEDIERAQEFREISDRRVPDHAPFFVYRIRAPRAALTLLNTPA